MTHPAVPGSDYDQTKRLARSTDPQVRRSLAARGDIRPELLYFLATDREPEVRREIAGNANTPRKADLLLATDSDPGVRTGLARKIARLVPDLSPESRDRIERTTLEILETLARDQTTEVRRILAEELQSVASAPPTVISRLARDLELSVCGPVLRNSPILSDDDLIEIIAGTQPEGALSAIAQRASVGSPVADAIAASDDAAAIAVLLGNPSAQIREETLDHLIDRAPQHEPWHGPLVRRPQLPARAAARLATFIADALLQVLQSRTDLGADAARQIADSVRNRLSRPAGGGAMPPVATLTDPPWAMVCEPPAPTAEKSPERPAERARRLHKEGKLTDPVIADALVDGDRGFVLSALAERTGAPLATVERVIATRSARAVTALAWRAGLPMRLARQIQMRLAQVPPKDVLNPRDGSDYPLGERDMRWQLDFFGIP
ncbi:MAG: DUF2336 domain-containing protein [Rhodospirillaceae bacterium]